MKCLQAFSSFNQTEELKVDESALSIAFFFTFGSLVISVRIISKTKNKKTKKKILRTEMEDALLEHS